MMIATRLKGLLQLCVSAVFLCTAIVSVNGQNLVTFPPALLAENRIIEKDDFENAPYIVASTTDNLIMGAGHEAYVRGNWTSTLSHYEVFRLGASYIDEESGESLGQEAIILGEISIVSGEDDGLKRALIIKSTAELKAGDRLLPRGENSLDTSFLLSRPSRPMQGRVVGLLDRESKAAQYDSIVIDLGARDGLRVGDMLNIERSNPAIRDPFSNKPVVPPPSQIGVVLTYRTFEKLSYGVILTLIQPSAKGDVVSSP